MKRLAWFLMILNLVFSFLAFAGPQEELFVHHEQNDNIKDIYRTGVFDTQLPEQYQSDHQARFHVPYFLIPLDSPELRQVKAGGIPANIAHHHVIEKNGVKYFKYLVHPAVLDYHKEKFAKKFTFVPDSQSEFLAAPTASERSLVLVEPYNVDYMVKVNLPLEINHRDRTMYPTEIKRGVWLTKVFRDMFERRPDIKKKFFVFDESFGAYPKVNGEALGGMIFREFPKDFYTEGTEVMPLFTLLALNPKTGKPLFFDFIKKGEDPWNWFEKSVLNPFKEIINTVTYEEGISLELHSQNVVVQVDTKNKTLTGRYGYRDLGSTHLDFYTLYATQSPVPYLDMIQDPKRELGGAYAKKTELEWLNYFFKRQISDLFFIQMAAHGLITREEREIYKKKAWQEIIVNHKEHYLGNLSERGETKAFDDVFEDVLKILPHLSCETVFAH